MSHEAAAGSPDVIYQVIFRKGDEILGTPTVLGQFGREVRIEIADTMRVIVVAETPDRDGRSRTSARMSIFADGAWGPPREMSMNAILSATPSIEYAVEDSPYRFVVMARRIVAAAG